MNSYKTNNVFSKEWDKIPPTAKDWEVCITKFHIDRARWKIWFGVFWLLALLAIVFGNLTVDWFSRHGYAVSNISTFPKVDAECMNFSKS